MLKRKHFLDSLLSHFLKSNWIPKTKITFSYYRNFMQKVWKWFTRKISEQKYHDGHWNVLYLFLLRVPWIRSSFFGLLRVCPSRRPVVWSVKMLEPIYFFPMVKALGRGFSSLNVFFFFSSGRQRKTAFFVVAPRISARETHQAISLGFVLKL